MTETMNNDKQQELRAKLNGETSRMQWSALMRFFAAGTVIAVADTLDLIDVAASIASDDKTTVAQWMAQGLLGKVTDEQASEWVTTDPALWTVVVKPWILVQEKTIRN